MLTSIATFPTFTVTSDLGQTNDLNHLCCVACHQPGKKSSEAPIRFSQWLILSGISVRISLNGHPYNNLTLASCQLNPRTAYERVRVNAYFKEPVPTSCTFQSFVLCRICFSRFEILHKISHQKHIMFTECVKSVNQKLTDDPMKAATIVLNELLADDEWLAMVC